MEQCEGTASYHLNLLMKYKEDIENRQKSYIEDQAMTLSKIIPDISEDCDSKYQQEVQTTQSQIDRMTEEI
jgi:hypothetical protein